MIHFEKPTYEQFLRSKINTPDAKHRGTMLNVSHCMFYKVVAVGFNTLVTTQNVGVLNPPHE